MLFYYINPLVILGAVGLMTIFASLKVPHSKMINWIAASSFAVFLIHCNPNLGTPYFKPFIQHLYNRYDGIMCPAVIGAVLIFIFLLSIIMDQPRKWIWKAIANKYFQSKKINESSQGRQ